MHQTSLALLMFRLFSKKAAGAKVTDKVYVSTGAKWKACKQFDKEERIFIAWFPSTLEDFTASTGIPAILARESHGIRHQDKKPVFIEHYPLREPEEKLFADLALSEVLVLSALDEPFFQYFNGDKLAELVKNLGLNPDEPVDHALVTKSIRKAQDKLADKKLLDHYTTSQNKWFENLQT
jgi:hypothetical protein